MKSTKRKAAATKITPAYRIPPAFGAMIVSEDIVPFGDFRTQMSQVFRGLQTNGRPIVVTQHGRPAAIVVPVDLWSRMTYAERLRLAVREGIEDVEAGRAIDDAALGRELDAEFGALPRR